LSLPVAENLPRKLSEFKIKHTGKNRKSPIADLIDDDREIETDYYDSVWNERVA
jgi:hypothetical protein